MEAIKKVEIEGKTWGICRVHDVLEHLYWIDPDKLRSESVQSYIAILPALDKTTVMDFTAFGSSVEDVMFFLKVKHNKEVRKLARERRYSDIVRLLPDVNADKNSSSPSTSNRQPAMIR